MVKLLLRPAHFFQNCVCGTGLPTTKSMRALASNHVLATKRNSLYLENISSHHHHHCAFDRWTAHCADLRDPLLLTTLGSHIQIYTSYSVCIYTFITVYKHKNFSLTLVFFSLLYICKHTWMWYVIHLTKYICSFIESWM